MRTLSRRRLCHYHRVIRSPTWTGRHRCLEDRRTLCGRPISEIMGYVLYSQFCPYVELAGK